MSSNYEFYQESPENIPSFRFWRQEDNALMTAIRDGSVECLAAGSWTSGI